MIGSGAERCEDSNGHPAANHSSYQIQLNNRRLLSNNNNNNNILGVILQHTNNIY